LDDIDSAMHGRYKEAYEALLKAWERLDAEMEVLGARTSALQEKEDHLTAQIRGVRQDFMVAELFRRRRLRRPPRN
jgi:chaperonin cofactor prefoldin